MYDDDEYYEPTTEPSYDPAVVAYYLQDDPIDSLARRELHVDAPEYAYGFEPYHARYGAITTSLVVNTAVRCLLGSVAHDKVADNLKQDVDRWDSLEEWYQSMSAESAMGLHADYAYSMYMNAVSLLSTLE